jgi:Carbohydrate-binding module 48 (Isoamylase N-terminal domain)
MRDDDDPDGHSEADIGRRVAQWYATPLAVDDGAGDRVMAALRAAGDPPTARRRWSPMRNAWHRLVEPRSVRLSPAMALAASAVFGAVVFVGSRLLTPDRRPVAVSPALLVDTPAAVRYTVRFVLITPPSTSGVALVGDFNGWDATATPLRRVGDNGTWAADVAVSPGRHVYAFVLDGKRWVADPSAALAPDDGFGARTSVVVVGRGGAA